MPPFAIKFGKHCTTADSYCCIKLGTTDVRRIINILNPGKNCWTTNSEDGDEDDSCFTGPVTIDLDIEQEVLRIRPYSSPSQSSTRPAAGIKRFLQAPPAKPASVESLILMEVKPVRQRPHQQDQRPQQKQQQRRRQQQQQKQRPIVRQQRLHQSQKAHAVHPQQDRDRNQAPLERKHTFKQEDDESGQEAAKRPRLAVPARTEREFSFHSGKTSFSDTSGNRAFYKKRKATRRKPVGTGRNPVNRDHEESQYQYGLHKLGEDYIRARDVEPDGEEEYHRGIKAAKEWATGLPGAFDSIPDPGVWKFFV